jgi:hypothetical protein
MELPPRQRLTWIHVDALLTAARAFAWYVKDPRCAAVVPLRDCAHGTQLLWSFKC